MPSDILKSKEVFPTAATFTKESLQAASDRRDLLNLTNFVTINHNFFGYHLVYVNGLFIAVPIAEGGFQISKYRANAYQKIYIAPGYPDLVVMLKKDIS